MQEAQKLAAVLASNETPLILGTLAAVANLTAFSTNQENFREAGLIPVLSKLIMKSSRQIKLKACLVIANMAMNEKNNAGKHVPKIFSTFLYLTLTHGQTCGLSQLVWSIFFRPHL